MGEMAIVENVPATDNEWWSVCKKCAYSTYFHTPEWANIFSAYTHGKMRPFARKIVFKDGNSAIVPLSKVRYMLGCISVIAASPAGTYGGWISKDNLAKSHEQALIDYLRSFKDLVWRENPFDPFLKDFDIAGSESDFTQVVDLNGTVEDVLSLSSRAHRKALQKARREGLIVREGLSRDDWQKHFEAYQASIKRWDAQGTIKKRNSYYRWDLFENIFLKKSPYIKLWVALCKGSFAASVICFYWNRHAVAWHGAAFDKFLEFRPNNLLYDTMIMDAFKRDYRWFDCNPSAGLAGVITFKDHLGAQRVSTRVLNKSSSPLKIARMLKNILHR